MPPGVCTSASPLKRLRVLLVEDCADDAQLILDALRLSGFDTCCQRVETEREYLAHLTPDLDVILADYSLPQFDGLVRSRLRTGGDSISPSSSSPARWEKSTPSRPCRLARGTIS